jgi:hypothetical protein
VIHPEIADPATDWRDFGDSEQLAADDRDEFGQRLRDASQILERIFVFMVTAPLDRFRNPRKGNSHHGSKEKLLAMIGLRSLLAVNIVRPDLTDGLTNQEIADLNGTSRANGNKFQNEFRDAFNGFQGINTRAEHIRQQCRIKAHRADEDERDGIPETIAPGPWLNLFTAWAMRVRRIGGAVILPESQLVLLRKQTAEAYQTLKAIHERG